MKRLGVFLDESEIAEIKELATRASHTSVINVGSGPDLASLAWQTAKQACHRAAMAHGLPEIVGYYGADLETGEVIEP